MLQQEPRKSNGRDLSLDPLRPLRSERLAIVGFSEISRHLAPYDDESVEIWICNRLGLQKGVKRWDRHFDPHALKWTEVHHEHGGSWEQYKGWLEENHGERLIYLPRIEPEVANPPNGVELPVGEIVAGVGGRQYFTNAISWQLGLALLLHQRFGTPKQIELYGIDLRGKLEYEFQRPNVEWLLGLYEGRGGEIVLPQECALLNQDNRSPLYGIELYSGQMGEVEMGLEKRYVELEQKCEELKQQIMKLQNDWHAFDGARQEAKIAYDRVSQFRRGGVF